MHPPAAQIDPARFPRAPSHYSPDSYPAAIVHQRAAPARSAAKKKKSGCQRSRRSKCRRTELSLCASTIAWVARAGPRAVINGRVAWRLRIETIADTVIAFRAIRFRRMVWFGRVIRFGRMFWFRWFRRLRFGLRLWFRFTVSQQINAAICAHRTERSLFIVNELPSLEELDLKLIPSGAVVRDENAHF